MGSVGSEAVKVLVTGASGFIGRCLMRTLDSHPGYDVTGAVRTAGSGTPNEVVVGSIDGRTDWTGALRGVEVVIHTAGRVHDMRDVEPDSMQAFREVNVAGTLNLARQAEAMGVHRLVFISTVKVNGEHTHGRVAFTADDVPAPADSYSRSKLEAEQGLMAIARQTGMEVVMVRPPVVYGVGVKGNFASLSRWVRAGLPLPFGSLRNRRAMIALDNLADLIITCIRHPAAANQVFLASDGEDLSLPEILERLAAGAGQPSRVFPLPSWLLKAGLSVLGKGAMARRLLLPLQVDISKTRSLLGWTPPLSVDEGLRVGVVQSDQSMTGRSK